MQDGERRTNIRVPERRPDIFILNRLRSVTMSRNSPPFVWPGPWMTGAFPRISPYSVEFANLMRMSPFAPRSSSHAQVS